MDKFNHLHLLAVLVVMSSVPMGLLALWAAKSRHSWTTRAVVLSLPLGCVLAIPAYEPLVYFFVQCIVVIGGVQVRDWIRRGVFRRLKRNPNSGEASGASPQSDCRQFSLKSLMLFTVMAAVLIAVAVRLPRHSASVWANVLLAATTTGISTLLGAWLACSTVRRWLRVPIAMLAALLFAVLMVNIDEFFLAFPDLTYNSSAFYGFETFATAWIIVIPSIVFITAIWLFLAHVSGDLNGRENRESTGNRNRRSMVKLLGRVGLVALTMVLVLPCAATYFRIHSRPAIPNPVAGPNGYDDIVAAGKLMIPSNALDDPDAGTSSVLAGELAKNQKAFNRLREGLSKPCSVPIDYTSFQLSLVENQSSFRSLARAVVAEGRLSELEGRYDDAVKSYLDVVRLAHCIEREGLLIDWLVGRAIEGVGMRQIVHLRIKLDDQQSDSLGQALRVLDQQRESFDDAHNRDIIWAETAYGWRGRLDNLLQNICYPHVSRLGEEAGLLSKAATRLTILELALQSYRRTHGIFPDRLDDLIPAGDWVTRDPFSENESRNFAYLRTDSGYLLYSIGDDGDDDGGRTIEESWTDEGDLTLGTIYPIDDSSSTGNADDGGQ